MRTAQELRAAADLLCSEIEENQILFSYYEFTEDEQEVILGHFIEYLNGKKADYETTEFDFWDWIQSEIDFSYFGSRIRISLDSSSGFWVGIYQPNVEDIFPVHVKKSDQETFLSEGTAHQIIEIFLDSCVFNNHLKTTA